MARGARSRGTCIPTAHARLFAQGLEALLHFIHCCFAAVSLGDSGSELRIDAGRFCQTTGAFVIVSLDRRSGFGEFFLGLPQLQRSVFGRLSCPRLHYSLLGGA